MCHPYGKLYSYQDTSLINLAKWHSNRNNSDCQPFRGRYKVPGACQSPIRFVGMVKRLGETEFTGQVCNWLLPVGSLDQVERIVHNPTRTVVYKHTSIK